jgi:hypothetical protein
MRKKIAAFVSLNNNKRQQSVVIWFTRLQRTRELQLLGLLNPGCPYKARMSASLFLMIASGTTHADHVATILYTRQDLLVDMSVHQLIQYKSHRSTFMIRV